LDWNFLERAIHQSAFEHDWEGRRDLLDFYEHLQSGLDLETQKKWVKRFHRPG
jgi:hypothetical protein